MSSKYYREHFYYEHGPAVYYKEVPKIDLEYLMNSPESTIKINGFSCNYDDSIFH